jgi:anthranilate phosphoribosyltransferase
VAHLELGEVVETCGMGADRGFGEEFAGYKTINATTLSAVVVAAMGIPAVKHGSYGNTAKVGSTDAAKILGLPLTFDGGIPELMEYWRKYHFLYLEAYSYKTIHDLSHLIKHETVNHLVGPMSVPVSSDTILHKLIGVNHNVDPAVVVRGYNLLAKMGIQRMGGIVAICGLSATAPDSLEDYQQHVVLGELSPFSTLVAVGTGDVFHGRFLVTHEDFGMPAFGVEDIRILNEAEALAAANEEALRGEHQVRSRYLAANAALALVARYAPLDVLVHDATECKKYLSEAYQEALDVIMSGEAWRFKERCSMAE